MALACKALEAISGKCLPLAFKELLFDPLGCEYVEAPYAGYGSRAAPLALAKIAQLHLNRGAYGNIRLFSEKAHEQLLPKALDDYIEGPNLGAHPYGMGTGWMTDDMLSFYCYGHGARSGCLVRVDPIHDLVIALTRNEKGRHYRKYRQQFFQAVAEGIIGRVHLDNVFDAVVAENEKADVEKGAMNFSRTFQNDSTEPFTIKYTVDTEDTSWAPSKQGSTLVLRGGEKGTLDINMTFDPNRPLPTPRIVTSVRYGKRPFVTKPMLMRPLLQRKSEAVRLATPPAIDGVIGPDEYADAPYAGDFRAVARPAVGDKPTRFCLGYDDEMLYMAAVAVADQPGTFPRIVRGRDGPLWEDNSMELFIDANHDHASYHHFIANLVGDRYDGLGGKEHGTFGDAAWNAEWETAAKTHEDRFVIEFAIPFRELGIDPPKAGDVMGLHVGRTRSVEATGDKKEYTGWAIVYINFHQVTHFGDVTFK
jgi:hypothetical protein